MHCHEHAGTVSDVMCGVLLPPWLDVVMRFTERGLLADMFTKAGQP